MVGWLAEAHHRESHSARNFLAGSSRFFEAVVLRENFPLSEFSSKFGFLTSVMCVKTAKSPANTLEALIENCIIREKRLPEMVNQKSI